MRSALRILVVFWASAAGLAAGIIVKDQQYRFCGDNGAFCAPGACEVKPGPACNKGKTNLPVIEDTGKYKLVFVEYRQNGKPWDRAQLESAKWLIQEERKKTAQPGDKFGGPINVFFYVHGWKNNANVKPPGSAWGDVERFKAYLARYADYLTPEARRPVIGIYFAWRGRSLDLPSFINWISFWTRSFAAREVGEGEIRADLNDLVDLVDQGRAALRTSSTQPGAANIELPPNRRPQIVVMGHSFGARVLETALIGGTKSLIDGTCKGLVDGQSQRPLVDLVLFENAATSATYIWHEFNKCQPCGNRPEGCHDTTPDTSDFSRVIMVRHPDFDRDRCKQNPLDKVCQPYPLLVSVSSQTDFLTRVVLFLASFQHPAAFLPFLQSHHLETVEPGAKPHRDKGELFAFEACCDGPHTYMVERKRTKRVSPANPIWSMAVPKQVIHDHGDVWNEDFLSMLLNLIASTDDAKAQQIRTYDRTLDRVRQMK